jgi:hypothetical protein
MGVARATNSVSFTLSNSSAYLVAQLWYGDDCTAKTITR